MPGVQLDQESAKRSTELTRSKRFVIYGATGYTGRLIAREAHRLGLNPVLAGRDLTKLRELANDLGNLDVRSSALTDARALDAMLHDAGVLLNAAGPFANTSKAIVAACLRSSVHYLDISGEVAAIEQVAGSHRAARERGIMLMAGVGFDVVPSDCLAAHVARRMDEPRALSIAVSGQRLLSRGSARTMIGQLADPLLIRRNGALACVPPASIQHRFDFGAGPRTALAVSWGDVASAYYSTGISDITTYFEGTASVQMHNLLLRMFGWSVPYSGWQAILAASTALMPEGPSAEERGRHRTVIVAEVVDGAGRVHRARLHAPEAYSFTALCAPVIARRVLAGEWHAGFETPSRLFGSDFVLAFDGVRREDLT
jgi:short subunit dehydrogenase-like uncharacterized protein